MSKWNRQNQFFENISYLFAVEQDQCLALPSLQLLDAITASPTPKCSSRRHICRQTGHPGEYDDGSKLPLIANGLGCYGRRGSIDAIRRTCDAAAACPPADAFRG